MHKYSCRFFALALCLCLLLGCAAGALAAPKTIKIASAAEFLEFCEACRLDSYSRELTVRLEADLDLGDSEFSGIPIFSGIFDGNGHSISGFSLTHDGSVQGFFRYLTQEAQVKNLTLRGSVAPEGSSKQVGGFAGSNAGRLSGCHFEGSISGTDRIGGLVGFNTVTGTLDSCTFSGSVTGSHFVGGIAGTNEGLIRSCRNDGAINTTVNDQPVDLSNISIHTVTGTEAINAVTDVGGIAGSSAGFLKACRNDGAVGYPHIGYNIGGIAGSQTGYLLDCRNTASVSGRKEVGGITGQLEPVTKIEYEEDSLQILQKQLDDTVKMADQASADAQGNASAINSQINQLQGYSQSARDALALLLPRPGQPPLSWDELQAATNTLTGSLSGMKNSAAGLSSAAESALSSTSASFQALVDQMRLMRDTLSAAPDHLGGSLADVSDADTEKDTTGKIDLCRNDGQVLGDLNIGGIAGAIAPENDLDPEDDSNFIGELSLNFNGEQRAVIRSCRNYASVSARKRNAGGITGRMSMGLVRDCVSTGALDAPAAEFVGGIVGAGAGFIRSCSAKCTLSGTRWVGGIAGTAAIVTDCRSMVSIADVKEKSGAVIGHLPEGRDQTPAEIRSNVYLVTEADPGGIDGISYEAAAAPLAQEAFLALPELDETFSKARVRFLYPDGQQEVVYVDAGSVLDPADIPAIAPQDSGSAQWEGLAETKDSPIYFDRAYHLVSIPAHLTIESQARRENDRPVLLMEGEFTDGAPFPLEAAQVQPPLPRRQTAVEGWTLPTLDRSVRMHLSVPADCSEQPLAVWLCRSDGSWAEVPADRSGSYLLFGADAGDTALCLAAMPRPFPWLWTVLGILAAAGVIALGAVLICRKKRRSSRSGK